MGIYVQQPTTYILNPNVLLPTYFDLMDSSSFTDKTGLSMDSNLVEQIFGFRTRPVYPESHTYSAYLGYEWGRIFINQYTASALVKSARNAIGQGATTPPRRSDGSVTFDEVPEDLRVLLFQSCPDQDFEPDPQLNVDLIHKLAVSLSRHISGQSNEKYIVQGVLRELDSIKSHCKRLLYRTLELQRFHNGAIDHLTYVKMEKNEDSMKNASATASVKLAKGLVEGRQMVADVENHAHVIEGLRIEIASLKKRFVFGGLILMYNLAVQKSSGQRRRTLQLPPNFDATEWIEVMGKVTTC